MTLVQEFKYPISGYWDYGAKKRFVWFIDKTRIGKDNKGQFVRVGSIEANTWFNVALGKTDKLTLSNARRKLGAIARAKNMYCEFRYENNR